MISPIINSNLQELSSVFRVRLRDPGSSDASLIFRWRNENALQAHQPLVYLSLDHIQSDIEKTSNNNLPNYARDRFQWIIERLSDSEPLGWMTLSIRTWEHQIGEIGYSISEAYHGQGYGFEALQIMLQKAFCEAHLYRVEAKCSVENPASYKLLEKVGFKKEGILREYFNIRGKRYDHFMYSVLRSEYINR
ncbi:GNAT family N-acetyltransferase [bacterium]|nr:MAG: GNAT family N-acetyltransferase [bacterium]